MTNPYNLAEAIPLQPLFYPNGPLVSEALKMTLAFYRNRFRTFLIACLGALIHIAIFFVGAMVVFSLHLRQDRESVALWCIASVALCGMFYQSILTIVKLRRLSKTRWSENLDSTERTSRIVAARKVDRPLNAEFLFYLFLTPQNRDALVGDLEERYKLIRKKFGERRANFWYWMMALRSAGPIFWWSMKKASRKSILGLFTIGIFKLFSSG